MIGDKTYGVWCGSGWLVDLQGVAIHSWSREGMQATAVAQGIGGQSYGEARLIGPDGKPADESPEPKTYGVWIKTGWLADTQGVMICSPAPNIPAAYVLNMNTSGVACEVREIGVDGLPVPETGEQTGAFSMPKFSCMFPLGMTGSGKPISWKQVTYDNLQSWADLKARLTDTKQPLYQLALEYGLTHEQFMSIALDVLRRALPEGEPMP